MATVRPNVFKTEKFENVETEVKIFDVNDIVESRKKVLQTFEIKEDADLFEKASIILAGGKGLRDKANFEKLYKLAELIGAKVGATRKAVDAGFAPQTIQIGQTGKTVSPDLYVAFGVSGAVQHCVGINGAKKIIAVNSDENAPITKVADKTIVTDAVQVIDELLKRFSN